MGPPNGFTPNGARSSLTETRQTVGGVAAAPNFSLRSPLFGVLFDLERAPSAGIIGKIVSILIQERATVARAGAPA
jgi:hypothetical protein